MSLRQIQKQLEKKQNTDSAKDAAKLLEEEEKLAKAKAKKPTFSAFQ